MAQYLGLIDMLDGGGAGRSGSTFEGGPLSGFLNSLGIRPMGYQDRLSAARPMPRPTMAPRPPAMPSGGAPVEPVTTQPMIGDLTIAEILEAIQRGAPPPYAQPTMPSMPTLLELMEADNIRRRRQAGIDLQMGFGNVFPQFTMGRY